MSKARKGLLALCGMVAVGLGAAGIFLPLLPTTPFLLLAAACFFRSSDRLYNWLITHRWFGRYIRQYREHRAISRQTKVATLVLLWGTLAFSGLVVLEVLWGRLLLLAVGVGVTMHIMSMKTLK
ncbi:MAG: YbaN family protein [Acidobacteria bacterium]|nr:YbaN family protein [Acidobacteriota bacterium]